MTKCKAISFRAFTTVVSVGLHSILADPCFHAPMLELPGNRPQHSVQPGAHITIAESARCKNVLYDNRWGNLHASDVHMRSNVCLKL